MSAEVILLAIGCYLFCGINEKIHLMKTGDWREGGNSPQLEKKISEFSFIPSVTTYENIIEKFGIAYTEQRTHRVIRKQKYNGITNYFDKEVRYVYRRVNSIETTAAFISCLNYLELYLFFKDNILVFYSVLDSRMDEKTCREYKGPLNTLIDKDWLAHNIYATGVYTCNEKFYRIFTLYQRHEWHDAKFCDFYNDPTYWDDPVYDWRKYFKVKGGMPCGGTIFNSC